MTNGVDHKKSTETKSDKRGFKNFFKLGEVGGYFFRTRKSSPPANFNIRVMHGINRLAIIIFVLGILYFFLKRLF